MSDSCQSCLDSRVNLLLRPCLVPSSGGTGVATVYLLAAMFFVLSFFSPASVWHEWDVSIMSCWFGDWHMSFNSFLIRLTRIDEIIFGSIHPLNN